MSLNETGAVKLETPRLILRKIEENDVPKMYSAWASKEECSRFFPWEAAESFEDYRSRALSWIENYRSGLYFQWIIGLKETGAVIGIINLHEVDEKECSAETSYILSPEYWGRGIMTEALGCVLKFGFCEAGFEKITAEVFAGNGASKRVLQKCKMKYLSTEKEKYSKNKSLVDADIYSAVKKDFITD